MVTKKIVSGLIQTLSFILIFFFIKFQILNITANPFLLGGIGLLLYLLSNKIAGLIDDNDLKLFIHGLIITASSVFFFSALTNTFTNNFLSQYSIVLFVAGIVLYTIKDQLTRMVVNNG